MRIPRFSRVLALTFGVAALLTAVLIWLAPFTRAEFLPFLGTAFGSALAVGSAIIAFEYQRQRDTHKAQQNFLRLLDNLESSSQRMLDELANEAIANLPLAFGVVAHDHRRLSSFLDKFEFEDLRFTEAGWWLRRLNPTALEALMSDVEHVGDFQEAQRLAHELEHWISFAGKCRSTIS